MAKPQDTLVINVVYSTEDKDYGPVYVATNDQIGLVTDGKTFEELVSNLREALAVCLDDAEALKQFNLVADPRIVLMMELTKSAG